MNAAIHLNEATKSFGRIGLPGWALKSPRSARGLPPPVLALDRVSFSVEPGEIFGLIGPAASGKTTLVRVLAALLPLDSGEARIFGWDVARRRAEVQRMTNRVSVEASFFKGLSPLENLQAITQANPPGRSEPQVEIADLLSRLGLDELAQSLPMETLNRKDQQLVFIARAVISRPRLLLLDEPFAELDLFARYRVCEALRDLRDATGSTILFTAREATDAQTLADRFARLSCGRVITLTASQTADYPVWSSPVQDCAAVKA